MPAIRTVFPPVATARQTARFPEAVAGVTGAAVTGDGLSVFLSDIQLVAGCSRAGSLLLNDRRHGRCAASCA